MTVVAGIFDREISTTWMRADTRACSQSEINQAPVDKITCHGLALVGVCGGWAVDRWARRVCPELSPGEEDVLAYLEALADSWASWSDRHGLDSNHEGVTFRSGDLLVGTPSGLWAIGCDHSIMPMGEFAASGSGGAVARGALHALAGWTNPEVRLRRAIEAACAMETGCGGMGELFVVGAP